MVESPPQPRPPMCREDRQLLWMVIVACGLVLAAWAGYWFHPRFLWSPPKMPPPMTGQFVTVQGYALPLALRREGGAPLCPAGVTVRGEDLPVIEQAAARLADLAPVGAAVYVELDPFCSCDLEGASAASLWIPPPGITQADPFPYPDSRLLAAVLVQEGLARVDENQSYLYKNELLLLEDDARRHGRGLWAAK
jgi:hypothetical protein